MNPVDRVAVGVTLIACGVGGMAQNWPLASGAVGMGLGMLLMGVLQLRRDAR